MEFLPNLSLSVPYALSLTKCVTFPVKLPLTETLKPHLLLSSYQSG